MKKLILLSFLTFTFSNCAVKEDTLEIGTGDDVKVTLRILNNKNIQKIDFVSNHDTTTVSRTEVQNWDIITYGFENGAEGTFILYVYTTTDTLHSENYVEKGYAPELSFDGRKINTLNHTGIY